MFIGAIAFIIAAGRDMKKFVKYSLWAVAGVVAVAVAGVAYLAATFNPNDYKAQLIQLVKDKQQRTLKLDGDIKLVFFPSIGVNLGSVSLSEFQGDQEFAAVDSARVSLALLPLLSKQIVVDEVVVSGLKAGLVKFKNGKSNIDDLMSTGASKGEGESQDKDKSQGVQFKFDIASVLVEKATLSYRDEATGAKYAVKDLKLQTGRIANGVPARIDFTALIQASQPKLDIATQMRATLTFDLEQQLYQVQGLDLQARGAALDISNLVVQASGDVSAKLATQEFTARKLAVSVTGVKGKDNFDARLDVSSLNMAKDKFSGDKLTLNAKLDGALGKIVAALSLHDLSGNAQLFKSRELALELDIKQPEQAFKVKLTSPVSGNFEQQQFNLSDLKVAVNASGDKLPNKSVSSEMQGSVQIDGVRQSVQASLAGGLLQSQVKARVAVKNFTRPAIRFDVDVDQFDADLYLSKEAAGAAPKPATAEQPLDFSALKELNLEGGLRIGTLKIANVKAAQLRIGVKAHNGLVNVSPLSANLYQGSVSGSLSINAQATPSIAIKQTMSGINIAPLLKDIADLDMLEGKGDVSLNLSAQGNTVSAIKKDLSGDMALNLADGAIKGINLTKLISGAQSLGKGSSKQTMGVSKEEKTEFSEFKASFKVKNGVAHNEDLSVKAQLLRMAGKGDIDIGNDSINYATKATLYKSPDGQGGSVTVPVHLSGPFSDLKYTIDYGAMVADIAKQKIDAKKEQIKTQVQDQLKNKLKGLFK